jgi:transposase
MRPFGTNEQLAVRRERGLRLLRQGKLAREIAGQLGATERSVRRWQHDAETPKRKKHQRPPGRPRRLSESQVQLVARHLKRGAYAHGYADDYWTLDRVARLIWDLFGIRYHPSGVWHVLQRLGWSSQKPQRRALQRDDAAIAHWNRYEWPQIKKVA